MIYNYSKTEILEFLYDNEEEREDHIKEMKALGYELSGELQINIVASLKKENWKLYGKFVKEFC